MKCAEANDDLNMFFLSTEEESYLLTGHEMGVFKKAADEEDHETLDQIKSIGRERRSNISVNFVKEDGTTIRNVRKLCDSPEEWFICDDLKVWDKDLNQIGYIKEENGEFSKVIRLDEEE